MAIYWPLIQRRRPGTEASQDNEGRLGTDEPRAGAEDAHLRTKYVNDGKSALFDPLKDLHPGKHGPRTYAEIDSALGLSERAIKSAVHRLRRGHGEILRQEISRTVDTASELAGEVRHLLDVLRCGSG